MKPTVYPKSLWFKFKVWFAWKKSLFSKKNNMFKDTEEGQTHYYTDIDTDKFQQRIGMLRQWLNECRIDDPKKMVTNEQLERWLFER